jgi:hypothetical protein
VTTQPAPLPAPGTTHSPAPWRVRGQSQTGRHITVTAANGRTVALVPWDAPYTPVAECTDARDAMTIALAPELLAALEDMVALVQERFEAAALSEDEGDDLTRRFDKAANLITKARGQ